MVGKSATNDDVERVDDARDVYGPVHIRSRPRGRVVRLPVRGRFVRAKVRPKREPAIGKSRRHAEVEVTLVDEAKYPYAKCLDGTSGSYYASFAPSSGIAKKAHYKNLAGSGDKFVKKSAEIAWSGDGWVFDAPNVGDHVERRRRVRGRTKVPGKSGDGAGEFEFSRANARV